jgi:threonine/homoserine/homoserine lactone efflux protein
MLTYLLQGLTLGVAATAQPGPFTSYLISQTLSHGWKRSWMAAFAPLLSDGPIIALTLLVLSQVPLWLQRGLNVAGGLFILYLAWGAFRQWRAFSGLQLAAAPTGSHSLLKAALINLVNPAPYIYWSLVMGPILLAGWRESPLVALSFLVAFYSILIGGLLAIMAVCGAARQMGEKLSRSLLGFSVLALVAFGLFQLWRAAFA